MTGCGEYHSWFRLTWWTGWKTCWNVNVDTVCIWQKLVHVVLESETSSLLSPVPIYSLASPPPKKKIPFPMAEAPGLQRVKACLNPTLLVVCRCGEKSMVCSLSISSHLCYQLLFRRRRLLSKSSRISAVHLHSSSSHVTFVCSISQVHVKIVFQYRLGRRVSTSWIYNIFYKFYEKKKNGFFFFFKGQVYEGELRVQFVSL